MLTWAFPPPLAVAQDAVVGIGMGPGPVSVCVFPLEVSSEQAATERTEAKDSANRERA